MHSPLLSLHPQRTDQRLHCPRETGTVWFSSRFPLRTWRCTPSTLSKVPTRDKSACCTPPPLSAHPHIQAGHPPTSGEHTLFSEWSDLLHSCECTAPTLSTPSRWDRRSCCTASARRQVPGRRDFPEHALPRRLSLSSDCHLHKSPCKVSILSRVSKQGTCPRCTPPPAQQDQASHKPQHCPARTHGLASLFRRHTFSCTQSTLSTQCTLGTPLPHKTQRSPIVPNSRCQLYPWCKHTPASSSSCHLRRWLCTRSTPTKV